MTTAIGLETASNFSSNFLSIKTLDHAGIANKGTMILMDLASTELNPAQTLAGLASAKNGAEVLGYPGATSYSPGSGTPATFAGGGFDVAPGTTGTPGIRLGTLSTGGVPNAFDLSSFPADDEYLSILWCQNQDAVPDGNQHVLAGITDSGAVLATGKLQFIQSVNLNSGGFSAYIAGVVAASGFFPVVGTVYQVAVLVSPNPVSGKTRVKFYINGELYNTVDITYAAFATLLNGAAEVGHIINVAGLVGPTGFRIYRWNFERITYSGRDPIEQIGRDYIKNIGRFT